MTIPPRSTMARLSMPVQAVWLQPTTGADIGITTLQAGTCYYHERPAQPSPEGEPQEVILVPDDQTGQLYRYRVSAGVVDEYLRQNDGRTLSGEQAVLRHQVLTQVLPHLRGARRAVLVLSFAVVALLVAVTVLWLRVNPTAAEKLPPAIPTFPANFQFVPPSAAPVPTAPAGTEPRGTEPAALGAAGDTPEAGTQEPGAAADPAGEPGAADDPAGAAGEGAAGEGTGQPAEGTGQGSEAGRAGQD